MAASSENSSYCMTDATKCSGFGYAAGHSTRNQPAVTFGFRFFFFAASAYRSCSWHERVVILYSNPSTLIQQHSTAQHRRNSAKLDIEKHPARRRYRSYAVP